VKNWLINVDFRMPKGTLRNIIVFFITTLSLRKYMTRSPIKRKRIKFLFRNLKIFTNRKSLRSRKCHLFRIIRRRSIVMMTSKFLRVVEILESFVIH